ncbi:MAG: cation transporter, partial [Bdellovibrionales bacterium]|nr:cation transporter [Massilia sp.]
MTDCCNKSSNTSAFPPAPTAPVPSGAKRFRIPAMDCASEESDIRRALADVPGIRSLNFQLVA